MKRIIIYIDRETKEELTYGQVLKVLESDHEKFLRGKISYLELVNIIYRKYEKKEIYG